MDAWTAGIAFGLLGTLLGGLIGHRLALGRDRRIEYNEQARPLLKMLDEYAFWAKEGTYPSGIDGINEPFFSSIYPYLNKSEKMSLEESVRRLHDATSKCGRLTNTGDFVFGNPDPVVSELDNLKKYVELK